MKRGFGRKKIRRAPTNNMKKCPYCAEEIQEEAIVCRFCGRDLKRGVTVSRPPSPVARLNPAAGKTLRTLARILFALVGIYSFLLDFSVLSSMFGFNGVLSALFCFPLSAVIVPFYLLSIGYWFPALVIYGGGILCALLDNQGKKLTGESE